MFGLSTVGLFLYFFYPVFLISISLYVTRSKEMTLNGYFFANRDVHWLVLGISFLTTCLFTPYLLGLTSSGLTLIYGVISIVMLFILGWFLAPIFFKNKINTLPEYFEKRFNRNCKLYLSALYIIFNIFFRLMIILIAGSVFINRITGIDTYSTLLFFLVVTGIYVIIGGLRAEIFVNLFLAFIITVGVVGLIIWLAYSQKVESFFTGVTSISGFNYTINSKFSFPGLILGLPIIGFWFWCADQFMLQKILSAGNNDSIKKASIVSMVLQIIPILIFVFPGIIVINLFHGLTSEDILFNLFTEGFLPEVLRGILIISVCAAILASFAGFFNSTSSLFTFDFYKSFKQSASDRKLVLVGRLTIIILLMVSILLVPLAQNMDFQLCLKMFKVLAYFASMVVGVFLIGILNKEINGGSALLTLLTGSTLILIRSIYDFTYESQSGENLFLSRFAGSNFLEFSAFIFFISVLFLFVFYKLDFAQQALNSVLKIIKTSFPKVKI